MGGEGMGGGMGGMGGGGMSGIMQRYLSRYRSARPEEKSGILNEPFSLTGADLYRLNCQSCHGPEGHGAPPEINSLIDPVRATSAEAVLQQMQARGRAIPKSMAESLAASADSAIYQRLEQGGTKMPPFRHLRGDEVTALVSYLKVLAGVLPTREGERPVPQSAARVGEHLVKGTCHICHDAVGPGGGNMAMMQGIIPSLASMPEQMSLSSVVRQVQYGSSAMVSMMGGQTMPAFPYFTQDEVAAGYFYLQGYPPLP
jgi:mono/diheme cytochrome c family protein